MSNLGKKPGDDDEVEQLLRAAQDDMLLKLSVNSHMARASASSAIDPDLDRRFVALKKPTKSDGSVKRVPKLVDSKDTVAPPEDDLFTRFAALKGSIPSHGGKEKSSNIPMEGSAVAGEEDNDEDEVEKVIKWAIDAARLDPSPPSDNEDDADRDHNDDTDDDDDSSSSEDDNDNGVGKGKRSHRK